MGESLRSSIIFIFVSFFVFYDTACFFSFV